MEMNFEGAFELESVSPEEAWLVLTDPIAIEHAVPGCKFLRPVEEDDVDFEEYEPPDLPTLPEADREVVEERTFEADGRYATMVQVSLGDIKPSFNTVITITEREDLSMRATGSGGTIGSEFDMTSGATVSAAEDGSKVEWWADVELSGKIAQYSQQIIETVADRTVTQFVDNIEAKILEVKEAEETAGAPAPAKSPGVVGRVRQSLGNLL